MVEVQVRNLETGENKTVRGGAALALGVADEGIYIKYEGRTNARGILELCMALDHCKEQILEDDPTVRMLYGMKEAIVKGTALIDMEGIRKGMNGEA